MSLTRARRNLQHALPFVVWTFVAIFGISALYIGGSRPMPTVATSAQRVFARIGGQEVSLGQFERTLYMVQSQSKYFADMSGQPITIQQQTDAPRQAYQVLIEEYAEAAAAQANGISVSEGEALAESRKRIDEQLKQVGQGSTPQQLAEMRSAMEGHVDGAGERRRLLSQRLREKLSSEARTVEVRVAHVLIKADKRTDEDARKLALDVARKARAGEDFAKLASTYSEDEGSKKNGGGAGWASAMPPTQDPKKKPGPDDAASFVPEFTAAALRLKPNEISDPVRSQFGYHVLKAVQERRYEPKDPAVTKDPKKREEAIQSYKSTVASQGAEGLFGQYRAQMQGSVQPESPWLKAFLKEQMINMTPPPAPSKDGKGPKPPGEAARLAPIIADYEQALKSGDPAQGPGLAYHVATLYTRVGQHAKAAELFQKWEKRSGDAEMFFAHGESLEKLKKKTDALEKYREAMDRAYNNPGVLLRITEKFKTLGRNDMAEQARAKQAKQLARQEEERKRLEAAYKKMASEKVSTKPAEGGAKTQGTRDEAVQEITVKTGDIDPKTGKPKILSVTKSKPGKDDKAGDDKPKDAKQP